MELPRGRRRPRIGRIPYLITAPFTAHGFQPSDAFEIITAPPRQLAHLAREDELDIACLPISDAKSLSRRFEPLGTLGLVADKDSQVALFVARTEADLLGSAPLGTSVQGASTVQLLELVLVHRFGVAHPNIVPLPPDRRHLGGLLLVGDQSMLSTAHDLSAFPHQYQLVAEWHAWTALPLVLGRWMVRKTLPDKLKADLVTTMDESIRRGIADPEGMVAEHCREQAIQWDTVSAYAQLQACRYHLGEPESQSIDHFLKLLRDLNQPPTTWRDLL